MDEATAEIAEDVAEKASSSWIIALIIVLALFVVFATGFFNQHVPAPGEPGYQAPVGSSSGSGEVTVTVVNKTTAK